MLFLFLAAIKTCLLFSTVLFCVIKYALLCLYHAWNLKQILFLWLKDFYHLGDILGHISSNISSQFLLSSISNNIYVKHFHWVPDISYALFYILHLFVFVT